jgi:uncharacterized protein (DUF1778 family)
MARYQKNYVGERRTRSLGIKLTPNERAEFEAAAEATGVPLSTYVRDLALKRAATVGAPRRNPQAKALLRELSAIGNNINQLARHANTRNELPTLLVLKAAMTTLREAMARVIEL